MVNSGYRLLNVLYFICKNYNVLIFSVFINDIKLYNYECIPHH
jgi:hypothetical protein